MPLNFAHTVGERREVWLRTVISSLDKGEQLGLDDPEWSYSEIFEPLNLFVNSMETSVSSLHRELEEVRNHIELEENQEIKNNLLGLFETHCDTLPNYETLYFSSFIVTWYSLMEIEFLKLCQKYDPICDKCGKGELQNFRLNKGTIDELRKFLKEILNYPIEQSQWLEFTHIQKIRNAIVHNSGAIKNEENLRRYMEKFDLCPTCNTDTNKKTSSLYEKSDPRPTCNTDIYVQPTSNYCRHLINFGNKFLSQIKRDLYLKELAASLDRCWPIVNKRFTTPPSVSHNCKPD